MDPERDAGRRSARAVALARQHQRDEGAVYVDAARYSGRRNAFAAVVVSATTGKLLTASTVRARTAGQAEEAAIALATAEGVHAQTAQQWPPKLRQTTVCDALRTAAQGPLYEEVLGKSPSNRSAVAYRKNDEEELFDFIKDYLFNRGGAQKLNSRSGNGRAQFVGVDSGGANGSAASGGADKDSGESAQRYKMHIIKFRLVNASHPCRRCDQKRAGTCVYSS
ncbi:hypothetical protein MRX96_001541 [Rhipicephalus microplus]